MGRGRRRVRILTRGGSVMRNVVMSIVGGLDIHRNQLTFDWVDKDNGRWERGRIAPADREHLARWLTQFNAGARVSFALEGDRKT